MSVELTDIVEEWLKSKGYDGLYNTGVCACELDDLMFCGEPCIECTAGYKRSVKTEYSDYDWEIGSNKPEKEGDGE